MQRTSILGSLCGSQAFAASAATRMACMQENMLEMVSWQHGKMTRRAKSAGSMGRGVKCSRRTWHAVGLACKRLIQFPFGLLAPTGSDHPPPHASTLQGAAACRHSMPDNAVITQQHNMHTGVSKHAAISQRAPLVTNAHSPPLRTSQCVSLW